MSNISEKFSDEHVESLVRQAANDAGSSPTKGEMVAYVEEFSRDMAEFSNEFAKAADAASILDDDVVESLYDIARELNVKLFELRKKFAS